MAKDRNQSMTSKSGSADVLTELGVNIVLPPERVSECIAKIGIGFIDIHDFKNNLTFFRYLRAINE